MSSTPSLGIVIPAYHPDCSQLVTYIQSLQRGLKPAEIRVELDDPLAKNVPQEISDTGATVRVSTTRRGKGAAITDGFEALDTDILLFLDADGATPVTSAASIIRPVQDGVVDIAIGSRRHPASTVTAHQTIIRRRLGDCFAQLARKALDTEIYDFQCGAKALSDHAWDRVRGHLYESGFTWDLELLAIGSSLGLTITEIPIIWEDQPGSTVDPIDAIVEFTEALIAVRHRAKIIEGNRIHSLLPRSRSQALVGDK